MNWNTGAQCSCTRITCTNLLHRSGNIKELPNRYRSAWVIQDHFQGKKWRIQSVELVIIERFQWRSAWRKRSLIVCFVMTTSSIPGVDCDLHNTWNMLSRLLLDRNVSFACNLWTADVQILRSLNRTPRIMFSVSTYFLLKLCPFSYFCCIFDKQNARGIPQSLSQCECINGVLDFIANFIEND